MHSPDNAEKLRLGANRTVAALLVVAEVDAESLPPNFVAAIVERASGLELGQLIRDAFVWTENIKPNTCRCWGCMELGPEECVTRG